MLNSIFQYIKQNTSYIRGNEIFALLFGVLVLIIARYFQQYRKRPNLPPGPINFPILGYYPFLRKDPERVLADLSKKYGNVISLYIGSKFVVFLNDWEAVKDGLGQNATTDRPPMLFANVPYKLGFSAASGAEWIQARRLTAKSMKDIGLQSAHWEHLTQEEVLDLAERIKKEGGRPLEIRSYFAETFTNNIITLMMGERLPSEHPLVKTTSDGVNAILENTPSLGMFNFSLTLAKILEMLGVEKKFEKFDKVVEFCSVVADIVKTKLKNLKDDLGDTFFDLLKKEIEIHHKNPHNIRITVDDQIGVATALLVGGSHTVRATTVWCLIAMADHPHIQQKVHEELDKVVGRDGLISWPERSKIPYTFATLLESMRWKTVAFFPALRFVNEDTKIHGYDIPKGSYLTTNNWALHNDTKYWRNPEQFIPERFLDKDGKKVNPSPDSYNPFSYGKRNCPGKLIALMEVLQYFVILMQKFKVTPKDGDKVKYDLISGLAVEATNAELRFIPR